MFGELALVEGERETETKRDSERVAIEFGRLRLEMLTGVQK